jgi:hypothetical protein
MEVFEPASTRDVLVCSCLIYINPIHTSQETHDVSATMPNRLMLFGETVAVYCETHTDHTNTLCGQNVVF